MRQRSSVARSMSVRPAVKVRGSVPAESGPAAAWARPARSNRAGARLPALTWRWLAARWRFLPALRRTSIGRLPLPRNSAVRAALR